MNLNEAFKVLDALNEDTFDLTPDGIKDLARFKQTDDMVDVVDVIDTEAKDESEIKDSYVGKVILDCQVCHSKQYKDKEDVVLDDTHTLANVGEECPYCYTSDGFKVIGEVVEFPAEEEKVEDKNPELSEGICDSKQTKQLKEGIKSDIYSAVAKHFGYSANGEFADLIADLVDRALMEEDDDIDESITSAIDEGLIYNKDIWTIKEFYEKATLNEGTYEQLFDDMYSIVSSIKDEDLEEKCINEDIKDISLNTDDTHIEIAAGESGKIITVTEPVHSEEVIVPVQPETEEEIEDGEEEMIDVDIDEFDNDTFDELGEKYLKKVYENVKSYKTTSVSSKGNHLVVEGIIKFTSGKVSPTSFLFESTVATKDDKVCFVGKNKNITRGNKAFTIVGSVNKNKLMVESFKYNYMTKDATGKSSRVYGNLKKR